MKVRLRRFENCRQGLFEGNIPVGGIEEYYEIISPESSNLAGHRIVYLRLDVLTRKLSTRQSSVGLLF